MVLLTKGQPELLKVNITHLPCGVTALGTDPVASQLLGHKQPADFILALLFQRFQTGGHWPFLKTRPCYTYL